MLLRLPRVMTQLHGISKQHLPLLSACRATPILGRISIGIQLECSSHLDCSKFSYFLKFSDFQNSTIEVFRDKNTRIVSLCSVRTCQLDSSILVGLPASSSSLCPARSISAPTDEPALHTGDTFAAQNGLLSVVSWPAQLFLQVRRQAAEVQPFTLDLGVNPMSNKFCAWQG